MSAQRSQRETPVDRFGRELRSFTEGEYREADDGAPKFRGHAAVFNRRAWIGPKRFGFWEQVAPKAFERSIGEADVRFLYNHDPDALLATTASKTLRLSEDGRGLFTDADLDPDDVDAQRVIPKLRSKKLRHMSFAFETVRDAWEVLEDGTELRTLQELKLYDVSVVTFPAYDDTDAALRSHAFTVMCRNAGIDAVKERSIIRQIAEGNIPDLSRITSPEPGSSTQDPETPEPGSSTREDGSQPGSSTGVPLDIRQRRHALRACQLGLTA